MYKFLDQMYISRHVMKDIPRNEIREFLGMDKNSSKREIDEKLKDYYYNTGDKEKFFDVFKDKINIPWWIAKDYLECSKTELERWSDELGYAFSAYVQGQHNDGYRAYYNLGKVMSSRDRLEGLREAHAVNKSKIMKEAAKKAAETRKKNYREVPQWIKTANVEFEDDCDNLKRYVLVARLSKSNVAYDNFIRFGKLKIEMVIDKDFVAHFILPWDLYDLLDEVYFGEKRFYFKVNKNDMKRSINIKFKNLFAKWYALLYENDDEDAAEMKRLFDEGTE